jgi:hypothetical protein
MQLKILGSVAIIFLVVGNCSGENKAPKPSTNQEAKGEVKSNEKPCVGNEATVECLKKNFPFFFKNSEVFWNIIEGSYRRAISDTTAKYMQEFLEIVPYIKGNVIVEEYFSGTIEDLFRKQSSAFLKAMLNMDDSTLNEVVLFLRNPTFNPSREIDSIFNVLKSKDSYKKLVELYFKPAEKDTVHTK